MGGGCRVESLIFHLLESTYSQSVCSKGWVNNDIYLYLAYERLMLRLKMIKLSLFEIDVNILFCRY